MSKLARTYILFTVTYVGSGSPVATHGISILSPTRNAISCGGSTAINGGTFTAHKKYVYQNEIIYSNFAQLSWSAATAILHWPTLTLWLLVNVPERDVGPVVVACWQYISVNPLTSNSTRNAIFPAASILQNDAGMSKLHGSINWAISRCLCI